MLGSLTHCQTGRSKRKELCHVKCNLRRRSRRARQQLAGHAHVTPIVASRLLDEHVAAQVFLSAKIYPHIAALAAAAFNAIASSPPRKSRPGLSAYPSGNHAQAVALVCQLLGIRATIVMPDNAPPKAATLGYGAHVVEYDPTEQDRKLIAEQIGGRTWLHVDPAL